MKKILLELRNRLGHDADPRKAEQRLRRLSPRAGRREALKNLK